MAQSQNQRMGTTRALITETEYEQLAGKHGDKRRYEATSRVRRRIDKRLTEDVEHLAEHNPKLLGEIREVVCPEHDGKTVTRRFDDETGLHVRTEVKKRDVDDLTPEDVDGDVMTRSDEDGTTWVTTDMETLTATIRHILDEYRAADEGEEGDR